MSDFESQIDVLVEEFIQSGRKHIPPLEDAIRIADLNGDVAAGQALCAMLVEASFNTLNPERGVVAFAWMRANMEWSDPNYAMMRGLIEGYFLVAQTMTQFAQISLNDIRRILTEMEADFQRVGWDVESAYMMHVLSAVRCANADWADDAFKKWRTMPAQAARCRICVADITAHYLLFRDRAAEAVATAAPIIRRNQECDGGVCNIPIAIQCRVLTTLLDSGDLAGAEACKTRTFPWLMGNQDDLSLTGQMLEYLGLTNQTEMGLKLIRHTIAAAVDSTKFWNVCHWTLGAGLLFRRCAEQRSLQLTIRLPAPLQHLEQDDQADADQLVHQLMRWCDQRTNELAEAFDERNGNNWHASWVEASRRRFAIQP